MSVRIVLFSDTHLGFDHPIRPRSDRPRRGAEPLYFEDVAIGDEVPYIIKGPVTLTSKLAFELATRVDIQAAIPCSGLHDLGALYERAH